MNYAKVKNCLKISLALLLGQFLLAMAVVDLLVLILLCKIHFQNIF